MAFHGLGRVKRNRILATADRSGRGGAELVTLLLQETKGVVGPGVDPMPAVQELYIELMKRRGLDDRAARNSWAAASGKSFEDAVRNALNTKLVGKGIRAESVAGLPRYPKHLKSFLMLPARRRCVQASFEALPDNDIMLLTRSRPAAALGEERVMLFGILSCKTSLRERAMQSCFWALATRDTGVRTGFVTQDRNLELRTCRRPSKIRMLLEAYFDRVFSQNPGTDQCGQVRPYEEIFADIERWRRDVAPEFVDDPWTP